MLTFNYKVFYLKIILGLYLTLYEQSSSRHSADAALSNLSNSVYKKILKLRTLPFEDCGSRYDILYLNISSCSSLPCEMQRGSTVGVNVIFDDNGDNTSFLKHQVRWIFNAIKTQATITPDPCDGNHECLVSSNDGKYYFATVSVDNSLPVIVGHMMWEAVDQRNNDVICFKVPVVISV